MGLFSKKKEVTAPRLPPEMKRSAPLRKVSGQRNFNFQAAETGGTFAKWTSWAIPPDELVFKSLRVLRARSRQLMISTDIAPSFINLVENHIVGDDGFRFCAKAKDGDKLDEMANKALQKAWAAWSDKGYCDFYGDHDEASFDRLITRTVAIDGEVFVQELTDDMGNTCFRLFDPETVPVEYNLSSVNGRNNVRFGIEYDTMNRPVAYYFRDQNGSYVFNGGYQSGALRLTRIPAEQIDHIFVKDRIDLKRGFPWMAPSMVRFRMLSRFEDAALQNAIVGASKVGILSGEGAADVSDEMKDQSVQLADTEAATIYETDADVNFHTFDTQFPSSEYASFVKTNLRSLAAGVGVNYNTLSGDLEGVNYSSLKHGTTEERENWKKMQSWFVRSWKKKQYKRWLKRALLVGIPVSGSSTLRVQDFDKYMCCDFRGRRWFSPDPLKEANAIKARLNANLISPQRVIIESGLDPDEIFDEIERYHAMMKEKGIPVEVASSVINTMTEESDINANNDEMN